MHRLLTPSLLALLAACGGAEAPPAAAAPSKASPLVQREEPKDRSQTPLVTTTEKIGEVSFSVDIPAGLKRDENTKDQYINWTFKDGNPFSEPSITVKLGDPVMSPRDLDSLARGATISQDKPPVVIARKEELPGGAWIVVSERSDGQFFKVQTLHRSGEKIVGCTVIARSGTGRPKDVAIPNFAATRAWAEKICSSIKIA
jgi:hypothetical protein